LCSILHGVKLDKEINVETFFQRRVRIYNTFRWVSLALIMLGFVIFLIGFLLEWNIWIYPWFGGVVVFIAFILPFAIRRVLRIKDPNLVKYLALGIDYKSGM